MENILLPPKRQDPKSGNESLHDEGKPTESILSEFWQWAYSHLLDNTLRGIFAEWLVATSLGIAKGSREEWGSYDMKTPDGLKIEVKSAAYVQSWAQSRYSPITFSIRKARQWDPDLNKFSDEIGRWADIYVFCLLTTKNQKIIDPLDINQWQFFIIPTSVVNDILGNQQSLGLRRLSSMGIKPVRYVELAATVTSKLRDIGYNLTFSF